VLTCNRGMSFGLFNTGPGLNVPLFTIAAVAIVAILLFWLSRVRSDMLSCAIGLIIGGAIGNVIDRLRFGGVIDFLYFHLGSWYCPAFNVADSAICIGVAVMLFEGLLSRRQGPQAEQEGDRLP
jgi:signal peptidase II